ncbi:MAG: ABC transporter ATP-binding protein [Oceanicoccus sp.]
MSLQLENVSLTVNGQPHIHPSNLTLTAGSMNVLLGPTLSGKTSLMRLMAGLDTPSTGKILWRGDDVTGVKVQKRDIAMVYQQFINYPSMTVFENIASPLRLRKKPESEIKAAVEQTADLLQLGPFLQKKPLELSGGQQQRCALARALVKQSGLVLLDEPLANLDYKLREELRSEIPKMFADSGAVFVYATTEPEEALLLGGNTVTLWQGSITQFDTSTSVYHCPENMITANVFSSPPMNFVGAEKNSSTMSLGENSYNPVDASHINLANGNYQVGFRPNHLMLNAKNPECLRFSTTLKSTEITGSETFLHLQHQQHHWVSLLHGIHDLTPGISLDVFVDPAHLYFFDAMEKTAALAPYTQSLKGA